MVGFDRLSQRVWTLAVFLTIRVLDFPVLTIDGSLPLDGALAATTIAADNTN
ncbi:MAG: hypothetical protein H6641_08995 [Caldilineaceae bacterium]|nr:hypothetical protein [Caldilineaceae bacterium]